MCLRRLADRSAECCALDTGCFTEYIRRQEARKTRAVVATVIVVTHDRTHQTLTKAVVLPGPLDSQVPENRVGAKLKAGSRPRDHTSALLR
jgi:hypothetical protein